MSSTDKIPEFTELNDLTSQDIGGKVLFATDDWFAVAENLLKSQDPEWKEGLFTDFGKWMDGWETRRKRSPGHDWCILRLGNWPSGGHIHGVALDTAFFTGNYPPKASIQAAQLRSTDEDVEAELEAARRIENTCASSALTHLVEKAFKSGEWETIVPMTDLKPGYEATRLHYFKVDPTKPYTHLRLNIFPDGGVARIRTYGVMVPPSVENMLSYGGLVDLVAMENGGVCEGLSDAHYGHPRNLIKKGRGINMGDGWETARRRDRPPILKVDPKSGVLDFAGGHEWCILKLGVRGKAVKMEVDTNHFKGNFPDSISVEAKRSPDDDHWPLVLLPATKLGPHEQKTFDLDPQVTGEVITHVRLVIRPDGGISRFRLLGTPMA